MKKNDDFEITAHEKFTHIEDWLYSTDTEKSSLREIELGISVEGRDLLRLLLQILL